MYVCIDLYTYNVADPTQACKTHLTLIFTTIV